MFKGDVTQQQAVSPSGFGSSIVMTAEVLMNFV